MTRPRRLAREHMPTCPSHVQAQDAPSPALHRQLFLPASRYCLISLSVRRAHFHPSDPLRSLPICAAAHPLPLPHRRIFFRVLVRAVSTPPCAASGDREIPHMQERVRVRALHHSLAASVVRACQEYRSLSLYLHISTVLQQSSYFCNAGPVRSPRLMLPAVTRAPPPPLSRCDIVCLIRPRYSLPWCVRTSHLPIYASQTTTRSLSRPVFRLHLQGALRPRQSPQRLPVRSSTFTHISSRAYLA